jgi:hypothetical protein
MLSTYTYRQLPRTHFGVCYTIFREIIVLPAQKLYAFCNVAIKCMIYPVFLNLRCCYSVENHIYFAQQYLKNLNDVS